MTTEEFLNIKKYRLEKFEKNVQEHRMAWPDISLQKEMSIQEWEWQLEDFEGVESIVKKFVIPSFKRYPKIKVNMKNIPTLFGLPLWQGKIKRRIVKNHL